MPEISRDGTTWTIKVKPGTYFSDDPAFKGKKRELTAADYLYSWKRTLDPKMRSPHLELFDGKHRRHGRAARQGEGDPDKLDYDAPVEGHDSSSTSTRCASSSTAPWWDIARRPDEHADAAAVAREVVEAYGDASGWVMANPVGTGPYRLKDWRRGQRILLEASPRVPRSAAIRRAAIPPTRR